MTENGLFRSAVGPAMTRYLALKRALGRGYANEQSVLHSLDAFLAMGSDSGSELTSDTFASWCHTLFHLSPTVRRSRMRIIRNFCLYRRRTESACFVPDHALFPSPHPPKRPYIFARTEVARLVHAAGRLPRTGGSPLRPELFRLVIVMLYTTGMRRGELLRLLLSDYDPRTRVLMVRQTKFHKSRYLPLSTDGSEEIKAYLQARRHRRVMVSPESPMLWNAYSSGRGYTGTGLADGLRILFKTAGIRHADGRLPRVHDFRHTFAVHALLRWYRSGADVQSRLPLLATYMGHVSVVSTQYYLRFIDDLAASVSARFERRCSGLTDLSSPQKGANQ